MFNQEHLSIIRDYCLSKRLSIAVAESVTGGLIQSALATAMDAEKFFQGGITAYNLGQKCRHLHIDPIEAEIHNCVSQKVADAMAMRVAEMFSSDYGLSITGYSTPAMQYEEPKPFAFMCIVFRETILAAKVVNPLGAEGMDARLYYTNHIIQELAGFMKG